MQEASKISRSPVFFRVNAKFINAQLLYFGISSPKVQHNLFISEKRSKIIPMRVCAGIEKIGCSFFLRQETGTQIYEIYARVVQGLNHLIQPSFPAPCLADIGRQIFRINRMLVWHDHKEEVDIIFLQLLIDTDDSFFYPLELFFSKICAAVIILQTNAVPRVIIP